jgi:acyl-homoserine-lactone acylase
MALAGASLLGLGSTTEPALAAVDAASEYEVTIRRGSYGVAHIEAGDYGSLGYGEGYAAAEDHVCNIGYGLLQARGELAKYLGAGAGDANLHFDALHRALDVRAQARAAHARQSAELKSWIAGYAAGYNRYLREHEGSRNDSWCSGAQWLVTAAPEDFMARMVLVAQTLPRMSTAIVATQPPAPESAGRSIDEQALLASLDQAALAGHGSNAWALGRDMTENGRGLLLANPHYPWYGGSRFWEKHLTIPGELDVYGAQLLGSPGVAIGFNERVGWTHTVSASQRLVLYRLQLLPEDPMRYRYGDETRRIEARQVSVPVRNEDGELQTVERSVYFSHYGPLLTLPGASWDGQYAYAVRDANTGNDLLLAQWLAMGKAQSMDAFIDAHRRYNAMPWVNTMATSADGRAVYLDNTSTGNLSEGAQQRWRAGLDEDRLAAGLYRQRGMVLLDGSDPGNEWLQDEAATIPGTTPFSRRPFLERSDYIFNANDSYWLTSPRQPLSGYSILYGPTETARSLRTRMNVQLLENRYGDAGDDGRFSIREVQRALFANRGLAAELLRPALVEACVVEGNGDAKLAAACEVLAGYDGSLNLDSPGAVLFREWLTRYDYAQTMSDGELFAVPFDSSRPVATPMSLADRERALNELKAAIGILEAAGLALDATLADAQFAYRGGKAIPVHGGNSHEGVANLQMSGDPSDSPVAGVAPEKIGDSRYLTDAGYPVVHGSSFILTLAFEDDGPAAEAILSYSQSGNPNAGHFADQTTLYADKRWRPVAFEPEAVAADTRSIRVLRGSATQSR